MKIVNANWFEKHRYYNDSKIVDIVTKPNGSIYMQITPLFYSRARGYFYSDKQTLLFVGVKNANQVQQALSTFPKDESEIGYLGIDKESLNWNNGFVRVILKAERRDFEIAFVCSEVHNMS